MKLRTFHTALSLAFCISLSVFIGACSSEESGKAKTSSGSGSSNVAPAITSSSPTSPSKSLTPKIIGTASSGSTVKIYTNSTCTGTPINSGSASVFASPGISVTVSSNSSTAFYVKSVSSSGTVSDCSTGSYTYVNDTTAPTLTETAGNAAATTTLATFSGACDSNYPVVISGAETTSTTCSVLGAWSYTATGTSQALRTYTFTQTDTALNSTSVTRTWTYQPVGSAPTLTSITLNSGDTYAHSTTLTATLVASSSANTMCITETAACGGCTFGTSYSSSASTSITATTGVHTVYAQVKDLAGNLSACVSDTITYEQLQVLPKYSPAPDWNDYYRTADTTTACDGSESGFSACTHGGNLRKVITTETACGGLSMADDLVAFDWVCAVESGVAVFTGTLKAGKTIIDLLNAGGTAFRDNKVTLTGGSGGTSYARAWWSNTVTPLTDNSAGSQTTLSTTGAIYTLAASQTTSGYYVTANKVSIVSLAPTTAILSWNDSATSNCNDTAPFSTTSANKRCIFVMSNVVFFSSDVLLDTTTSMTNKAHYGVLSSNSTHTHLKSNYTNTAGDSGNYNGFQSAAIYLKNAASNLIEKIRTYSAVGYGIRLDGVSQSTLSTLKVDTVTGIGIQLSGSSSNTLDTVFVDQTSGDGIQLKSGSNSNTFSNISVSGSTAGYGLSLLTASNSNSFSTLTVANPLLSGIYLSSSKKNKFYDFKSANAGSSAVEIVGSKANVFSKGLLSSSTNGVSLSSTSTYNIFSRMSATNMTSSGVSLSASSFNTFYQFLIANTGTGLSLASSSDSNTFAQLGIFDSSVTASLDSSSSEKFTGNFVTGGNVAACTISGGTTPGLTAGCAAANSSDHTLSARASLSSSWYLDTAVYGQVQTTDATNNSYTAGSNTNGLHAYPISSIDQTRFANSFRVWGKQGSTYPNSDHRGACQSGTCQIWDFSLDSTDGILLGRSGNGTSANSWPFVAAAACPTETDGTQYLYSQTFVRDSDNASLVSGAVYVSGSSGGTSGCASGDTCKFQFLKNAVEDSASTGNLNGLCESSDTCVYTPNFGFYQGSGVQAACTWTAGTVTGVTMQGLPTNGE